MQAKHGKPARSARLKAVGVDLSREARMRLSWMDFYRETKNVALTCRRFGISRQTGCLKAEAEYQKTTPIDLAKKQLASAQGWHASGIF